MFKSCRNLFNLSRKLGSVVGGLGLAGVLFTGQVSATPPWSQSEKEHLANVVGRLVQNNDLNWDTVAEQLNRLIPDSRRHRVAGACRTKWYELAKKYEYYRRIYDSSSRAVPSTPWTDDDIRHLAGIVRELVRAGNGTINWDTVAEEFNSRTNQDRTSKSCLNKWYKLAKQNEEFRSIYNPKAISSTPWTDEDIRCLSGVVFREFVRASRNDTGNWDIVAEEFNSRTNEDRTPAACRNKWSELAKQNEFYRGIYDPSSNARSEAARRGWGSRNSRRFTPAEDARLMGLVREYGENQWGTIARLLDARKSARQCRDRYRNYLQPINRVPVPIPQITTASLLAAPITGSDNQSAVNATDTSNAATQSRQMLPLLPWPFPDININIFLNE